MKLTKAERKSTHSPNSHTSYHQRALPKGRRLKILNKKEKAPLPLNFLDTLTRNMIQRKKEEEYLSRSVKSGLFRPSEQLAWDFGFCKDHWGSPPLFGVVFLLFVSPYSLANLSRLTKVKHLPRLRGRNLRLRGYTGSQETGEHQWWTNKHKQWFWLSF